MKTFNERIQEVPRGGWIRAGIWCTIYIAFVIWVAWGDWKSLWWLLLLPLIADLFTTKYIPWSWWKKYKPAETDRKFTELLRDGNRIGIGTFFHYCQQFGVRCDGSR